MHRKKWNVHEKRRKHVWFRSHWHRGGECGHLLGRWGGGDLFTNLLLHGFPKMRFKCQGVRKAFLTRTCVENSWTLGCENGGFPSSRMAQMWKGDHLAFGTAFSSGCSLSRTEICWSWGIPNPPAMGRFFWWQLLQLFMSDARGIDLSEPWRGWWCQVSNIRCCFPSLLIKWSSHSTCHKTVCFYLVFIIVPLFLMCFEEPTFFPR